MASSPEICVQCGEEKEMEKQFNNFCFISFFHRDYPNCRRHIIMCRQKDFDKKKIKKMVKRVFPELFTGRLKLFPAVKIGHDHKDCPVQFIQDIEWHIKNHDWEVNPFVGLRVLPERATHCTLKQNEGFVELRTSPDACEALY